MNKAGTAQKTDGTLAGATFRKQSQIREIWRRMKKNRAAILGLVILAIMVSLAALAGYIRPYEAAIAQNVRNRLQPPSAEHWFGTDGYGRDLFARCIHGGTVSLWVGFSTSFAAMMVGGIIGAIAGFYGGALDNVIMRTIDVLAAIPSVLLALAVVAALGSSTTNLIIAISFGRIPQVVRMVRSAVLSVANEEYVEAARAGGTGDGRITYKHILPNAIGPIMVQTTMGVAQSILAIATLSFIGLGVMPPTPEWGSIISESKEFLRVAPYLMTFPGLFIILSTLSLNLVGDGLRDALDPRLRT